MVQAATGHAQGPRMTVALAGNPNAGKTTLFNALTGARQHVGNYPGITVDKKEGFVATSHGELHVLDLPGTYSLTAYSQEELVARHVLIEDDPRAAVNVVNAAVLERNLYLTVQLLEIGVPVVLSLNMMDEARRHGMEIDADRLAELLGCPVVPTVARTGAGVAELAEETARVAVERGSRRQPLEISYGPDLDPVLSEMTTLIEERDFAGGNYSPR